jgi:hypothetical protein
VGLNDPRDSSVATTSSPSRSTAVHEAATSVTRNPSVPRSSSGLPPSFQRPSFVLSLDSITQWYEKRLVAAGIA